MPRGIRKQKFRSGQMVEAVQSCAVEVNGVTYVFNSKSRPVRADHPAVESAPQCFQAVESEYLVEQMTAAPGEKRDQS